MESSRSRNGIGAGRAGAVVAIVAGLVALPPAFAAEDPSAGAPPPDADGIVGNEETGTEPAASDSDSPADAGAIAGPSNRPDQPSGDPAAAAESGSSDTTERSKRRAPCANTDAGAETLTNAEIARSILCLVNKERKQRNRDRVQSNGDLDQIARKHSLKMEAQDCFEHKCQGEPGLGKRVKRSGYTDGAERWRFAENLGCSKTTRGMLGNQGMGTGWLGDDFNRTNLLNRRWDDVGVGIVHGSPAPVPAPNGCPDDDDTTATYTLVFAFRRG